MIDILRPLIKQFMPFAQKQMGFSRPPKLFLKNSEAEASNHMGKTGFYDPGEESITLYIGKRHPKDIMRSLSHELMHHTQKCNGEFDNVSGMGEQGYAQKDPHMRNMELQAYQASIVFRDWEDSLKETIYYEHLQKGDKKMSTKDWKNKEISTLLSEAWGFKFNTLEEFDEFNGKGELQAEVEKEDDKDELSEDEEVQEEGTDAEVQEEGGAAHKDDPRNRRQDDPRVRPLEEEADEDEEEVVEEGVFSPNHYCVHHGGVSRNGSVEMAEAVNHNFDEELGKVTHYDMKFDDGTIMEGVPFEDIQVTNASLAEGHKHPPGKIDEEEEEKVDESADDLKEAIVKILNKHLKG